MLSEAPSRRSTIGDNDPDADNSRIPPARPGDLSSESPIAIDLANEASDIANRALDFDDQQGTVSGMPGKDVDRAALAEDRERDLGLDDPLREGGQPPNERFRDTGVPRIEKPIEIRSLPSRDEIDLRIERREEPAQNGEARPVEEPTLDSRCGRGRHFRPAREGDLGHTATLAEGADHESNLSVVHRR